MLAQLVALAYALFGGLLGYLFSRSLFREKELERFFFVWTVVTVAVFTFSDPFLFFGVAGFVLYAARPRNPEDHIPYYILSLHIVPSSVGFSLPFPGLNYLIFIDFAKLSAVAILLPLWFDARNRPRKDFANRNLDLVVIAYFVLVSALSYRSLSFTSVARVFFDNAVLILLPYFAIKSAIFRTTDIYKIMRYWVIICLVLAFLALISEYKFWNFYPAIPDALQVEGSRFFKFSPIRTGILRVKVMLGPASLGFALSVGIIFAQHLKQQLAGKKMSLRVAQAIFLIAIYFTQARGGWVAMLAMSSLYLLLFSRSVSAKLLIKSVFIGAIFLLAFGFGIGDFLLLDEHGTFQYRYDLILNAWEVFKQNPLLGSAFFLENEALEASRQGQGIIDIVNSYLQVVLSAGILGMSLFVLLMVLPIIMLRRLAKKLDMARLEAERDVCNLMVAVLSGLGLLLGTISLVGVLPQYLFLFVGIAAGTARIGERALTPPPSD